MAESVALPPEPAQPQASACPRRSRELDDDGRRAMRQAEAVPILERLRQELDRLSIRLLPKSGLAQAVTYALNQWRALCHYTEDGRLTIDNNVSERRLRDQAIGRKNWMFLGSVEAGPRAAVPCTIIAGAKRHRLDAPQEHPVLAVMLS